MERKHFFEIIDQPWCPKFLRQGVTDYLQTISNLGNPYRRVLPHFCQAIRESGTERIIDLGSGAGGPWFVLQKLIERDYGISLKVTLTDLHPQEGADLRGAPVPEAIDRCNESIDATAVPENLKGFRTLFALFHHFEPHRARAVLQDAVSKNQPIAVFEMTHRSLISALTMMTTPIPAFFLTPLIRPFRWSRFVFTYMIPLIPIVTIFDGIISCLRTYGPKELERLVRTLDENDYEWKIGQVSSFPPTLIPMTYLIGWPKGKR